ncbi:MAG: hypothetical protein HYY12_08325 [Candidatus Methylomirabilis oxyfera]|nr:hypothetical protein [Candidatus Methylomirabilis oxyfera]
MMAYRGRASEIASVPSWWQRRGDPLLEVAASFTDALTLGPADLFIGFTGQRYRRRAFLSKPVTKRVCGAAYSELADHPLLSAAPIQADDSIRARGTDRPPRASAAYVW